MMQEGSMRCCSLFCCAAVFVLALSSITDAAGKEPAGIEVAENAEQLINSCRNENIVSRPRCLNQNLNRKWKYELDYAGKPFSAQGRLEDIKRSIIGNLFAFIAVGKYWVVCKVTEQSAEKLNNMKRGRMVLVSGIMDSYNLIFNMLRFHHLRLAPYCSIEMMV
jgi:hypothetical protein